MAVGLVIVSHSVMLAAGVAELAGQMAQGKVLCTGLVRLVRYVKVLLVQIIA